MAGSAGSPGSFGSLGTVAVGDRVVDVEVSGPSAGPVLLYHHGTPGAVTQPPYLRSAAHERGMRLVTFSRAGYGSSTRDPGRRVADAARDAEAVLDAVGASRCVVAGWSGGGPHALATAALLPHRVSAVVLMASVAPSGADDLDFLDGMGADNLEEFAAAAEGEAALRRFLEAQALQMVSSTVEDVVEAMGSLLPPVDQEIFRRSDVAPFLLASFQEGLRHGVDGWIDDDLAFLRPWGFDLGAPDRDGIPVSVWQGSDDLMVPGAHGRWLADHVPGSVPHLEAGEGHVSIVVGAVDRMLDEVAPHR
ncbi:MAG: alpha/beta fold hydrolase [Lapillicoccus sp.]